jgi:membrane fusion protein, adhesin transport system
MKELLQRLLRRRDSNTSRELQLRHLSQSIRLEEAANPQLVRATMLMISLAILTFVVWSAQASINELARAPGEVVPEGLQRTVQHLEGGMVAEILVREGQVVGAGELLLRLNGSAVRTDLTRARSKELSLSVQGARLRAYIAHRAPDFTGFAGADPQFVGEQQAVFESMLAAEQEEREVIKSQIGQKRESIALLHSRQKTGTANLALAADLYQRYDRLYRQGHFPRFKLIEAEQALNSLKGEVVEVASQVRQAEVALKEFEDRLTSLDARHRDDAYQQLNALEAELRQNRSLIAEYQERVDRLSVRAPIHGLVKGLTINTIGAVVAPGQVLMEIIPLDEVLVVEVRISPKDIGHLSVGQPVQVRVSSYDFGRYGSVAGVLESLSATTFVGERGERFYQGRVRLDQNHVGNDPTANPILPGMTVMADIVTGNKTILGYLLKPIQLSLKTAFTER